MSKYQVHKLHRYISLYIWWSSCTLFLTVSKHEVHKLHQRYQFMSLVFTHMPGESYQRQLSFLLLCLCDVFRPRINSLVCWFFPKTSQELENKDLKWFRSFLLCLCNIFQALIISLDLFTPLPPIHTHTHTVMYQQQRQWQEAFCAGRASAQCALSQSCWTMHVPDSCCTCHEPWRKCAWCCPDL